MNARANDGRRWLRIALYSAAGFLLAIAAIAAVLIARFQPIARQYFLSTLQKRYDSEIELGDLRISLYPVVRASGDNLTFWFHGRHDGPPLVQIRRFSFQTDLVGFFRSPKHIDQLRLEGLQIHIPSRDPGTAAPAQVNTSASGANSANDVAFVLDEVIADGATLEIAPNHPEPNHPAKDPLTFDIERLTLHTVGVGQPMTFVAELTNPKPPGLIHSTGRFGPWNAARPADTAVSGAYTLRNADLSVFKGIAGSLSSDGQYSGQLSHIEVDGTTDSPDFALSVGGHPMPLHTEFQATVDGANGDTLLHPVRARLGSSEFDVSGSIERDALEKHKTILLTAQTGAPHSSAIGASGARLEDFLRLAVKGPQPPMTGGIRFNTRVRIPPGETGVMERLQLDGSFALSHVKFTSAAVQQTIAALSHRAQGDPTNHDSDVNADFQGTFHLRNGQLGLPNLQFTVPGATVNLKGSYGVRTGSLDFRGSAKLDATVSQMTTGLKRKLLRPLDPFFRRDGAGTVLPIKIGGTRGEPSFRLDIGRILKRD